MTTHNSGTYVAYANKGSSSQPVAAAGAHGSTKPESYSNVIKNQAFSRVPPTYLQTTSTTR